MTKNRTAFALAAVTLLAATQVQAHAKLLGAKPAVNTTVGAPKQIVLKFSEKLQPKFSGAALTMSSMNNMAVPAKASVAKDRVTMTLTPTGRLPAGAYMVSWHAVTADTHRMEGKYSFTVR